MAALPHAASCNAHDPGQSLIRRSRVGRKPASKTFQLAREPEHVAGFDRRLIEQGSGSGTGQAVSRRHGGERLDDGKITIDATRLALWTRVVDEGEWMIAIEIQHPIQIAHALGGQQDLAGPDHILVYGVGRKSEAPR